MGQVEGSDTAIVKRGLLAVAVGLSLVISNCAEKPGKFSRLQANRTATTDHVDSATSSRNEQGTGTGEEQNAASRTMYFDGDARFTNEATPSLPQYDSSAEGHSLSFNNAEIRIVVGAVLGDMLGVPHQVHPGVQGTMTLQSSSPLPAEALVPALEAALRLQNLAVVDVAGTFHVLPVSEAPKRVTAIRQSVPESVGLPGFGVQIVPLRYTSPVEMRKVLEPFAPQGGILRVDEARNMLVLAGTSQELSTMLQTIATFDVDWMKGMSFALYTLQYVEAKTLADELLQIFGDADSPLAGMVRLIPIPRLNAILGISAQGEYLRQVEDWVERLDLGGGSPGRRIYVYGVKNARAGDLAGALGSILGTQLAGGQRTGLGQQGALNNPGASNSQGTGRPGIPAANASGGAIPTGPGNRQGGSQAGASGTQNAFEVGGLRIIANDEANSLLILATPSEYGVIEAALRKMDVPPRQVLIEASLAEVTLTDELSYGVSWFFEFGDNQVTLSDAASGGVSSQFPGFSYVFSGSSDARTVLNALASVTDVNLISSPKLMVLNNQSATLQVGDQVPVATQSSVSTTDPNAPIVNTVQFRDTGVILTVTPRIGEGGAVMLDITQEVSDVVATTSSGIDSPTIQQRKIQSSVVVQSGDTIALGGLIRESLSKGNAGIPYLKDVPLLGNLFRSNNTVNRRTELIILITPRIAKNTREAREILDYLQGQFKAVLAPKQVADESEE